MTTTETADDADVYQLPDDAEPVDQWRRGDLLVRLVNERAGEAVRGRRRLQYDLQLVRWDDGPEAVVFESEYDRPLRDIGGDPDARSALITLLLDAAAARAARPIPDTLTLDAPTLDAIERFREGSAGDLRRVVEAFRISVRALRAFETFDAVDDVGEFRRELEQ